MPDTPPPAPEPTVSRGTLVATAIDWFMSKPPLRKLQDIAIATLAALVIGVAWTAYQNRDEIVKEIVNVNRGPHLDVQKAAEALPRLWNKIDRLGCIAVQVYAVNLEANTIELVAVDGRDRALIDAVRKAGVRTTFISTSLGDEGDAMRVAAAIMQGDPTFGKQPLEQHRGVDFPTVHALFVPLPDEPGTILQGVVVCNWDITSDVDEDSIDVRTARLEVMEYASGVTR